MLYHTAYISTGQKFSKIYIRWYDMWHTHGHTCKHTCTHAGTCTHTHIYTHIMKTNLWISNTYQRKQLITETHLVSKKATEIPNNHCKTWICFIEAQYYTEKCNKNDEDHSRNEDFVPFYVLKINHQNIFSKISFLAWLKAHMIVC